jgi:acyl-CoA synthetase (NDP forming)
MVLASGFGESGVEGREREARLRHVAASSGIRVIGPSCLGIANLHRRMVLTGNAAFAESGLVAGGIFCASQSGSMIGALLSRGRAKDVHFAGLISVGGELDLSLGELCEGTLDDPNVTSYMLFLEALRDAPAVRRFAAGAAERGKPIVALKLGRSEAAAELATSHTGGLAGEDDIASAFLADCGIARVETLEALLESGPLLRRAPLVTRSNRPPTVGIVTTTGGGAALVVDQLGLRGIEVESPNAPTLQAIRATGVDVAPGRIADLTLAGVRYDIMKASLEAMLTSGQFDLVIAVVGSSARFQPELAVKPIIDIGNAYRNLATFIVPEAPQALTMLMNAEIPVFRTPEACADAVAATLRRRAARALELPAATSVAKTLILDELEGYTLLKDLGVPFAAAVAVAADAVPDAGMFPAAVKVVGREIAHKTDIGGVVLGVRSPQEFATAAKHVREGVAHIAPDISTDRLLAQRMVDSSVGELLLGYRVDPQVGPLVVLASGGAATEVLRDRALRMAPVSMSEARAMLSELKGLKLLTGFRGRPAGDLEAVARAIVALSQLAERPEVTELEINPLMVLPVGQGALAVDVVARIAADAAPSFVG